MLFCKMTDTGSSEVAFPMGSFVYVKPSDWNTSWGGVPEDGIRFPTCEWDTGFDMSDGIKLRRFGIAGKDGSIRIGHLQSIELVESNFDWDAPFGEYTVWKKYDFGFEKPLNWTIGYRDAGGNMRSYSFFKVVGCDDISDDDILVIFREFYEGFYEAVPKNIMFDGFDNGCLCDDYLLWNNGENF